MPRNLQWYNEFRQNGSRLFIVILSSIVFILGGFGAYSLWTDSGFARGGSIASGGLDIVSLGDATYRREDGANFNPDDDLLESGQTVKITIPVVVRVTGTELKPTLNMAGWSIPDELKDHITVSVVAAPVAISDNVQNVAVGIDISAAVVSPLATGVIDLSTMIVSLTSETAWQDSRDVSLSNIVTGSGNKPPTVTPLFSAADRGDSTLDFTPFSGQIGNEGTGQVDESQYLKSFFSAEDTEDGDLSEQVEVTSTPRFNGSVPGQYSIAGTVVDSGGLSTTAVGKRDISVWNLVQVDVAYYNVIALDSRGRPWSWGANGHGENHGVDDGFQLVPTPIVNLPSGKRAISVEASNEASFVVMDDGSVYSFGADTFGQLGNGSSGDNATPTRINFPGNPSIIDVEAFEYSIAALASDGSVYTWGNGAYAALGLGNATSQQSPQKINVSGALEISMGLYGGIASISGGRAVVWGSNWYGQNGDGTINTSNGTHTLPTVVPGLSGVTKVAAGYDFMLAATSDGSVFGWGLNTNYRSNPNTGATNNPVPMPYKIRNLPQGKVVRQLNAGFDYGQVVYDDGKLWSWGHNSYDSLFLGDARLSQSTPIQSPIASNVAMVAGEYNLTLYLNESGTMIYGRGYGRTWSFGNNSTANYIENNGLTAQISLERIYMDGTGVDESGDPTELSDSVLSIMGARRFGAASLPMPGLDDEAKESAVPSPSSRVSVTSTVPTASPSSLEVTESATPPASREDKPSSQSSEPTEGHSEEAQEPTEFVDDAGDQSQSVDGFNEPGK